SRRVPLSRRGTRGWSGGSGRRPALGCAGLRRSGPDLAHRVGVVEEEFAEVAHDRGPVPAFEADLAQARQVVEEGRGSAAALEREAEFPRGEDGLVAEELQAQDFADEDPRIAVLPPHARDAVEEVE